MQVAAFKDLYEKYQDTETSPATEPLSKIMKRLEQPQTYYYFIELDDVKIGAVRVVDLDDDKSLKVISPIFILKEYRRKGYAQKAIRMVEEIHGNTKWELNTILQEAGNCALYERMGYTKTGRIHKVNDKMTLVYYKK